MTRRTIAEDDDDEDIDALIDGLAATFDLTREEAETLQLMLGVSEAASVKPDLVDAALAADLARAVSIESIARALSRIVRLEPDLEPFIRSVEAHVGGPDIAGPRFILATIAEARDAATRPRPGTGPPLTRIPSSGSHSSSSRAMTPIAASTHGHSNGSSGHTCPPMTPSSHGWVSGSDRRTCTSGATSNVRVAPAASSRPATSGVRPKS